MTQGRDCRGPRNYNSDYTLLVNVCRKPEGPVLYPGLIHPGLELLCLLGILPFPNSQMRVNVLYSRRVN